MAAKRASAIHAEWWASGTLPDGTPWQEQVMLRGTWPASLEYDLNALMVQKAVQLGAPTDGTVDRAFLEEHVVEFLPLTPQQDLLKVRAMVLAEGTSMRYEPTPEQEAAGLPGDEIPFDDAWFDTLAARDRKFILAEIANRSGSIAAKAAEETAGPGLPLASSLAISSNGILAATPAPPDQAPAASPITGS